MHIEPVAEIKSHVLIRNIYEKISDYYLPKYFLPFRKNTSVKDLKEPFAYSSPLVYVTFWFISRFIVFVSLYPIEISPLHIINEYII